MGMADDHSARTLANRILCGDAEQRLQELPDECVDTIITSPPYYQQRNYADSPHQLGQEATVDEYVRRLTRIFVQCRRVLKSSGSLWLVQGDKYVKRRLLGVPWRVALALMDADPPWLLRNDVIWHKPNAMPTAARNRLTVDHEYLFFFSKTTSCYYDADAIRQPHVTFSEQSRMRGGRKHFGNPAGTPENGKNGGQKNLHRGRWDQAFHPKGRNRRTVWSIPLSKSREAHFAVFPPELVRTCLLATCPPGGLVLDPFVGSGTTALVAKELQRSYLGIDCVPEYCEMARSKLD